MYDVLGRLKNLLSDRGISIYRLSKETGIPQSTISTWYSNSNLPPIDKLEIICKALGMSLADFFCDEGTIPVDPANLRFTQLWQQIDGDQKQLILDLIDALVRGHNGSGSHGQHV